MQTYSPLHHQRLYSTHPGIEKLLPSISGTLSIREPIRTSILHLTPKNILCIFKLPLSSEPISVSFIELIFRLVVWVTRPTKVGLEVKVFILPSSFFRIFYQKIPYYLLLLLVMKQLVQA